MDLEKYSMIKEMNTANKEADILMHQSINLFLSTSVQRVLLELKHRDGKHYCDCLAMCGAFNYGYILGKRAERARRKGGASND